MKETLLNTACFSNGGCPVLLVAVYAAVLGASPSPAAEDAQDQIKNLEAFVDEVDRVLEHDHADQRITRFHEKLDDLVKQADGDVAEVVQQILQGDDKVIARAYASWLVLEGAKFGHGVIPSKAVPSDVAAQLMVGLMLQAEHGEDSERKIMTVPFLVGVFARFTSDQELIKAVQPHLKTNNTGLKNELHQLLAGKFHEHGPFSRPFHSIASMLKAQDGRIDVYLVQFMFLYDTEEALLTLADFYVENQNERKSLLLAYRTLDTAIWKGRHGLQRPPNIEAEQRDALATLSEHEQWWARLYTAQIMKKEPVFRLPELFNNLKNDEHPLVREALKGVKRE
ncbi:MAG: hypothetical protein WD030_07395 [Pirellulales bacterium]